jgi:hypothetical protein
VSRYDDVVLSKWDRALEPKVAQAAASWRLRYR